MSSFVALLAVITLPPSLAFEVWRLGAFHASLPQGLGGGRDPTLVQLSLRCVSARVELGVSRAADAPPRWYHVTSPEAGVWGACSRAEHASCGAERWPAAALAASRGGGSSSGGGGGGSSSSSRSGGDGEAEAPAALCTCIYIAAEPEGDYAVLDAPRAAARVLAPGLGSPGAGLALTLRRFSEECLQSGGGGTETEAAAAAAPAAPPSSLAASMDARTAAAGAAVDDSSRAFEQARSRAAGVSALCRELFSAAAETGAELAKLPPASAQQWYASQPQSLLAEAPPLRALLAAASGGAAALIGELAHTEGTGRVRDALLRYCRLDSSGAPTAGGLLIAQIDALASAAGSAAIPGPPAPARAALAPPPLTSFKPLPVARSCQNYDGFAALLGSPAPAPLSEPSPSIVSPSGIVNLRNTCFLNSALQTLARSPALAAALLAQRRSMAQRMAAGAPDAVEAELLADGLAQLRESEGGGRRGALRPTDLADTLERSHWHERRQQQDASEAIGRLLESASTAGAGAVGGGGAGGGGVDSEVSGSPVEAAVATVLSKTTTCAAGHTSCKFEKFALVPVPFAAHELPGAAAAPGAPPPPPRSLAERLVARLHETEQLGGDARFRCDACGGRLVDAVQTTAPHRLPASLLVALQRTAFVRGANGDFAGAKVRVPVPIDEALTLAVGGHRVRYELAAVVQHEGGATLRSGHYTAYVRCRRGFPGDADGFALISDQTVEDCLPQAQSIGAARAQANGFVFLYNAISVEVE